MCGDKVYTRPGTPALMIKLLRRSTQSRRQISNRHADPEIASEPMDDSFHKVNTVQTCVLIPHALSTHQPLTASKTVNIAAKKRRRLKRRENGIRTNASPPKTSATAPRAHLPSLCKLGTSSVFTFFSGQKIRMLHNTHMDTYVKHTMISDLMFVDK
jgi:hypothetical protein